MAAVAAHNQQQQVVVVEPNRVSAETNRGMAVVVNQTAAAAQQQQALNITPNRITAESKQSAVIANSQGAVGLLEDEKFEVKETTTPVIINGIYNRTNHYIHQSREYVGGAKLTRYINFPTMFSLSVVAMVVSLPAPAFFILAFIMAGIDFIWFCIFVQHMYVTVRTMPHMMRLPRVANNMIRTENGFFEVKMERYQTVFKAQADAGIGITVAAKGTVKLHILTHKAVCYMRCAMFCSTVALLVTFALTIYCFVFGIVGVVAAVG